jgi:hypothetical protein
MALTDAASQGDWRPAAAYLDHAGRVLIKEASSPAPSAT